MKESKNLTKRLTESAVMIALATVLSLLKLVEMPYGGSVTFASMVPIVIIGYRHGAASGLLSGFVFSVIQQLLGLNNLSYVTGWQSVLAVILLDYILAFTVVGLGGIFKNRIGKVSDNEAVKQSAEMALGAFLVSVIRYVLHTVAGATVWAGLSIPTEAALIYSLGYNATYMIPETVVTVAAAAGIGSVINFLKNVPTRFVRSAQGAELALAKVLTKCSVFLLVITVIADTLILAPHLQNAEDGSFSFAGLADLNPILIIVVSSVGIALTVGTLAAAFFLKKKTDNN